MPQSKAHTIKSATRNLKATIATRRAEYLRYRYGTPNARAVSLYAPLAPYARAGGPNA
jgi:hypothetical protein